MKLWFATFSALVFAIGLLAGLVLDRTWLAPPPIAEDGPRGRGPRDGPPGRAGGFPGSSADVAESTVNRLDRDLHLSEGQKRDLHSLLAAWETRMRTTQEDVQQQFRDEQEKLRQDVIKLLTPAQAARFDGLGGRALSGPMGGRGGRGPFGRGREGSRRE
jgi:hypothetical protein